MDCLIYSLTTLKRANSHMPPRFPVRTPAPKVQWQSVEPFGHPTLLQHLNRDTYVTDELSIVKVSPPQSKLL